MTYVRQRVGAYWSTQLPDFDFETRSAAGYEWDAEAARWRPPIGATRPGLGAIGTELYAAHPTTAVTHLAYDLKDGQGRRQWLPGMPPPFDLLTWLARFDPDLPDSYDAPGLIEAHNAFFEARIWHHILHRRHGWPDLHPRQLRCSMAKARAYGLPAALGNLSGVLGTFPKDAAGEALIRKYAMPRQPLKSDGPNPDPATLWRTPTPLDAFNFALYNLYDIKAESAASAVIPDLIPQSLDYWLMDQACNARGLGVDIETVRASCSIIQQAQARYGAEIVHLTDGAVKRASEVQKLLAWLRDTQNVHMDAADEAAVDAQLARDDLPAPARRALEIRQLIGSASAKKVFAMLRMATPEGRLCNLFNFHGARTGRDTHADVQPGNLPKFGPPLRWCEDAGCGKSYGATLPACPHCGTSEAFSRRTAWNLDAVEPAIQVLRSGDLDTVERVYGDALATIRGCIRSMISAGPGNDLICSDYSSIEAVVLAMLAGEQWRVDAFHNGEQIYLHGAAGVTGRTYEYYIEWAKEHGHHHPDRNKLGKVAELALGYAGWINAWYQFGGEGTEQEVRDVILKWRAASPAIVEFWGGQFRGTPWRPERMEFFGLEGAAVQAVLNPGQEFHAGMIGYQVIDDVLQCRLPSGSRLAYHQPRVTLQARREGWVEVYELTFMTWNSNQTMGPMGWHRVQTFGGRLGENVVQGVAFDIMAHAAVQLERAGYPIVLRVHDELAAEVPEGTGSIEEFETIMGDLPAWAQGWPIKAAGGWRGKRFRKDD